MIQHFIWLTYSFLLLATVDFVLTLPYTNSLKHSTAYSTEYDGPSYDTKLTVTVEGIPIDTKKLSRGLGIKRGNMTGGMFKRSSLKKKRQLDDGNEKPVTKTVVLSKTRKLNSLNNDKIRKVKDGNGNDVSGWERKIKTNGDEFNVDYGQEDPEMTASFDDSESKSEPDDGSSLTQDLTLSNGYEEESIDEDSQSENPFEAYTVGLKRVGDPKMEEDFEYGKGRLNKNGNAKPVKCLVKNPDEQDVAGYFSLSTCSGGTCRNTTKRLTTTTPFFVDPSLVTGENIDDDSFIQSEGKKRNKTRDDELSGSSPSSALLNDDLESQDEYYDSISERTAMSSAKKSKYKSLDFFDEDYNGLTTTFSQSNHPRITRSALAFLNGPSDISNSRFSNKNTRDCLDQNVLAAVTKNKDTHKEKKHALFPSRSDTLATKNRTKRFFVSTNNHRLIEPIVYSKARRKHPKKSVNKIPDYDGGWRHYWTHTKAIWDPNNLETGAQNIRVDDSLDKALFKRSPGESGKHKWDIDYLETPYW